MTRRIAVGVTCLIIGFLISAGCKPAVKSGEKNPKKSLQTRVDMKKVTFFRLDGQPVTLSLLSDGKPLLLFFFASWCETCANEVHDNNKIFEKYKDKGLSVYGVNVGDERRAVVKFIKDKKVAYPVVSDPDGTISPRDISLIGMPLNIVLDKDGNEIYRDTIPPAEDILRRVTGSVK